MMPKNQENTESDLISAANQSGIVVLFGEILADIFPDRAVLGGAPFNVARHLRAFGLAPLLITRVGADKLGRELLATMTQLGMITQGVQQDTLHQTGQVIIKIEEGTHRFEIPSDQAYDFIQADEVHQVLSTTEPELVYFGTLAQRNDVSRNALNSLLHAIKRPHVLDINLREPWFTAQIIQQSLSNADIVKMNEEELKLIAGLLNLPGKNADEQAAAMIQRFSLQRLVVTCGSQGAWQLDADGRKHLQQSIANIRVVDTVGAGDGFTAVFITGTLKGWPEELTLSRANSFAAALCEMRGAIPNEPEFYHSFLEKWAV